MKTLYFPCLLLVYFLSLPTSFSQPFVQTYHDFEPNLGIDGLIDFGFGVSTSVNNDWAIVGATSSYDANGGNFRELAGAAYLYHRNPKLGWNFFQKIVPSDRNTRDLFGDQVVIFQDHLIVSAIWDDDPGSPISQQKGSVYVFGLDTASVWQEQQKLLASDAADGDYFGEAIALGAGVAMVGVYRKDFDAGGGSVFAESGAVYVFTQDSSGLWVETQKLLPTTMNSFDHFGTSVSIRGDWAAVGVPREDQDAQGNILPDAGAVYLYQRDSSNSWQLQQVVTHSDREIGDFFGQSVDLGDSLLIVGAIWEEDGLAGQFPLPGSGAAYIFRQQANGQWVEVQKLVDPDRPPNLTFYVQHFGHRVAIQDSFAMVSKVKRALQSAPGQVYVYQEQADGSWPLVQEVIGFPSDDGDLFGHDLDFDGTNLIAGSPGYEAIPNVQWGVFKIFELCEQNQTVLRDTTCPTLPVWFGGEWIDQPGTYLDSLTTATGCDSVIQLNLVVETLSIGLTQNDSSLIANEPNATYQWLDCGAGDTAIAGATARQFVPERSGSYALVVEKRGCSDTSACVAFISTNTDGSFAEPTAALLPNPSQGAVNLTFSTRQSEITVQMYDLAGKRLATYRYAQAQQLPLQLSGPAGVYLIEVTTQNRSFSFKHILQP